MTNDELIEDELTDKIVLTTYKNAIDWLGGDLILCNNIGEVDESIYENFRFSFNDEEDEDDGKEKCGEIFQWYLTSFSEDSVKWLEKTFEGMFFTYSNKLDLYVLCVDHCGTSWDYVPCKVKTNYVKQVIINKKETYGDLTSLDY